MGLTVLSLSPGEKKQTGNRWWQNTFSLSTSSSSSSSYSLCKSNSDDIALHNWSILHSSSYLNKHRRTTSSSRNSRLLTRVRKFRHLSDKEVDSCRVSGNVISSPLPLPLPDLDVLVRPHVKFSSEGDVPLPSPAEVRNIRSVSGEEKVRQKPETEVHIRSISGEEIERRKLESLNDAFRRCTIEDGNRRVHNTESLSSRRSLRQPNGNRRIPDHYQIYIPRSAPSSPVLSPQLSPDDAVTNQFVSPPSIFQVWSAPEMPSSAYTPDPAFCYQIRHDIALHKGDNSPIHGPGLSPERSRKSYNETVSSLCNKLPIETQVVRRDNNVQANGHPLPLPPGNPLPLPPCPAMHPPPKLDLHPNKDQWQKGKLIGRGTFGSVYVASNKETGALCAMKEVEILPDDPKSAECIKQLQQEIEVLSNLKHPNIVQYYGSERVGDRFYIFLEFVHPGSINRFIRDHCGGITESVVRNFTRHILCGLAYLHSKKTIHRDIKGANLLVDAYGVVKLADFGMAKHLQEHAADLSLKGSPYWMAPELIQAGMHKDVLGDHALAIDIWSLGCTIIEMMNGKPPWSECEGPAAMFKALTETPPIPENLSAEGKDFLNCCFRRNPAERPTASMLLEHSFIKNPHPPEVISSSQTLGGMKLTDKVKTQGESLPYKIDQVAASLPTEFLKGRATDNFKHVPFSPVRLFNHATTKL